MKSNVCHSIVMGQTRLECFGAFIVYMSTVSNVKITFSCVEFVSRKSRVYTCINIYGRTKQIACGAGISNSVIDNRVLVKIIPLFKVCEISKSK